MKGSFKPTLVLLGAAFAAGLLLSGCGGDAGSGKAPSGPPPSVQAEFQKRMGGSGMPTGPGAGTPKGGATTGQPAPATAPPHG